MGRKNNQKILKGYWRSRRWLGSSWPEKTLEGPIVKSLILSSPFISKIEYHHISYNKLNIIIYGSPPSFMSQASSAHVVPGTSWPEGIVKKYLEKLFNKKVNLLFINLSYPYLDAQILAQYILEKTSAQGGITGIVSLLRILLKEDILSLSKFISGIRVEIKGLSGKMLMSKKIIKSVGKGGFNSSNSIREYGFVKSLNKKGIIGIKVWINYTGVKGL